MGFHASWPTLREDASRRQTGVKGARVVWMGDDKIATTGFSKMSERQVGVWNASSLSNIKMLSIDQSAGVLMPFWSDNGLLFIGPWSLSYPFFSILIIFCSWKRRR